MKHHQASSPALANAVLLAVLAAPAQAYADPGSGLLLWQLLGAALVGALFFIRKGVAKIAFWRGRGRDRSRQ